MERGVEEQGESDVVDRAEQAESAKMKQQGESDSDRVELFLRQMLLHASDDELTLDCTPIKQDGKGFTVYSHPEVMEKRKREKSSVPRG